MQHGRLGTRKLDSLERATLTRWARVAIWETGIFLTLHNFGDQMPSVASIVHFWGNTVTDEALPQTTHQTTTEGLSPDGVRNQLPDSDPGLFLLGQLWEMAEGFYLPQQPPFTCTLTSPSQAYCCFSGNPGAFPRSGHIPFLQHLFAASL